MRLLFRRLDAGEMERPPTQRDQFNNDDVGLSEALVREAIQNSLDARAEGVKTVRVRFSFATLGENESFVLRHFLNEDELRNHLKLSGMLPEDFDSEKPRLLVIEDFGTRGLEGSWDSWDNKPFCDFWRRMGLSHKRGGSLGRWGLGKLVFSSASAIRCFFGLTVRESDPGQSYLMGQAVLTTHEDGASRYDSHGFFALQGENGIQVPERSATQIAAFQKVCRLKRRDEAGLSVVVPYVHQTINREEICRAILRNYFFPLLTGGLEVTVDDIEITAATFAEHAAKFGDPRFKDGTLAAFILRMQQQMNSGAAPLKLGSSWMGNMEGALGESLGGMRDELNAGELVAVRIPILLKRKNGEEQASNFDLYLQRADGDRADTLFVRETIVLPAESKYFHGRRVFAALIAREQQLCAFLGDAENPAHTSWSASAEKVTQNWRNPAARLKEVRVALQQLYNALVSAIETVDPDALVSVFSTGAKDGGKRAAKPKGPITRKPRVPDTPPPARPFRVSRAAGGFVIRGTPQLSDEMLPLQIRVRAAYDVLRGNPFKKHDPLDFDFTKKKLAVSANGATVAGNQPNVLLIDVQSGSFEVQVTGFDINRDLIIDPARMS